MNYVYHLMVLFSIYLLLAYSLNILVGYSGLLSVAHAASYGIGAYASALLVIKFGYSFPVALLAAVFFTALLSLLLALPALRVRGDYFMLTSLGFQIIVTNILNNWASVTNGPLGVTGIQRPTILSLSLNNVWSFLIGGGLIVLICLLITAALLRSPFGLALKAVREDEIAVSALGRKVPRIKLHAFIISSGLAAIAGALYAAYATFIDPTTFSLSESLFVLTIVLIGGSGNLKGPLIGTAIMIGLPEALRFLHIPSTLAANIRLIIYGFMLVILMRIRPQGIAGDYALD
jgi:branched-chain amino acid transport system permease protein